MRNVFRNLSKCGRAKTFIFYLMGFVVLSVLVFGSGVLGSGEDLSKEDVFGKDYISKDVGFREGTFTFKATNPLNDRVMDVSYSFTEFSNGVEDYVVEYKVPASVPIVNHTFVCREVWDDLNKSMSYADCVEDGSVERYIDSWVSQDDKHKLVLQPSESKEVRITARWEESALKQKVLIDVVPHVVYVKDDLSEVDLAQTEWALWDSSLDNLIGYWQFDGNLSDSADSVYQGGSSDLANINGTSSADMTYETDCVSGSCIQAFVDAVDDDYYLTFEDVRNDIRQNTSFTWCGNVKSPYNNNDRAYVFNYGSSADYGLGVTMFSTFSGGDKTGVYMAKDGTNSNWFPVNATAGTSNVWQFFCFRFDQELMVGEWFMDGVPFGQTSNVQDRYSPTNQTVNFAGVYYAAGFNYALSSDLWLDEVSFWNKSLSDSDMEEINSTRGNFSVQYPVTNTAPTLPAGVTLTPPGSTGPDFDLSCAFTPVDPDNETLTAYVDWYNNTGAGGVIAVQNDMIVNNDTSSKSFVLDDANTTIGEKWNCSVQVCDHQFCSDWVNSSETEIISVENKTDFTTQLQSLNVKNVFVYDASKENWNRTDQTKNWYYAKYESAVGEKFPDKVYLFLTNVSLDIFDASDTDTVWMRFENGTDYALESTSEFTSVYALDGKIYVGSDKGVYILDFANDNISRYDSSGLAYFDSEIPFEQRNGDTPPAPGYTTPEGTGLASNGVNDVHANRVKGKHLVAVATDGGSVGGVNVVDMSDGSVATLRFFGTQANFDSDSVVIADDGTLYYSENNVVNPGADNNKVSYKYSVESYNGSSSNGDGYYASKGSTGAPSSNVTYPHFPTLARITNIYVTSYTSRMHDNHNTVYVATEKGVSVIQEVQGNEGVGGCKLYGFTGSTNSELDYKVLAGSTDNVTAVAARTDGNAMYAGTNSGVGAGSVSEISLNSNTLTGSWNKETDPAIVGNDTTSVDFLDGDLLIGTLDSGATQIVKHELDHYLITDYTNHRVVEIDNTGLIHWVFGVYGTAGNDTTHLTYPTNAVRHTDGNYLIADSGNRRILEVNPDRVVIQEISNLTQLSDATFLGEVYSVQKITRT